MVCFPGDQGHINPFLRMAKILASKGLLVTFSTSLSSGNKMSMAGGGSSGSGSIPVGDGLLRFEFFDDGADMAVDALDVFVHKLSAAGPAALEDIIRRNAGEGRPVKHIVGNPFLPWVARVADRMGIRWSLLWVTSFTVFSVYYRYFRSPELFPSDDGGWAGFEGAFPGLPRLKTDELPGLLFPSEGNRCLREVMMDTLANLSPATWALFETFEELESPALAAAHPLLPPPANFLPIGPLAKLAGSLVGPAGDLYRASDEVVEWLEGQPAGSVLYVAFGSVAALPPGSVAELAGGLRESGRRFLWAVKPAGGASETGVPAGFEAEVAGRGMVVLWCPQEKVLAHPAVGAFLTHCGWNSTLEAVAAGKPVVALPQFGDQLTNAKFLVEVYGVGVRMRAVTAAEVLRCAAEVFDGEGAAGRRAAAEKWREKAAAAVAAGGSSEKNLQLFVDYALNGCE